MDAKFQRIAEIFAERNLRPPDLKMLRPNVRLYEIIAIQPNGSIATEEDFIGSADRETNQRKFTAFLHLATEKQIEVALSPEYSCPWDVIANALRSGIVPDIGNIWILGCEAITPDELNRIVTAHPDVEWIYETLTLGTGRFYDPIVYVLQTRTVHDEPKIAVVVQFKTQPMGGDPFERDRIICGETIYIWHNPDDNIRLITLICSEALGFDQHARQECRIAVHPYLIFHPQLNGDPCHVDIGAYRDQLFAQESSRAVEVLTLNWARGFSLPTKSPSLYGASAIFTKSADFDLTDYRIEANHRKGLFYAQWFARRTHLGYLSYDEHIFHFRMPKVKQEVEAVSVKRTGPQMLDLWSWDIKQLDWILSDFANDGYSDLCASFNQPSCDYFATAPHSAIDRERLLTMSAGKLTSGRNWHQIEVMESFKTESDERSKRLTFTHEQTSRSRDFRLEHLARYTKLQTAILSEPLHFPRTIEDLKGDCGLRPPRPIDNFRYNLFSTSGLKASATVIYLGLVPPSTANQLCDNLMRDWGKEDTRRLVVWYEFQNATQCKHAPLPSITDDLEPPASIANALRL